MGVFSSKSWSAEMNRRDRDRRALEGEARRAAADARAQNRRHAVEHPVAHLWQWARR